MRDVHTTDFYRGRLPHWEVDRGVYFVTTRLLHTLPESVHQTIRELMEERKRASTPLIPEIDRRVLLVMERTLDSCCGDAFLVETGIPEMIREAIRHRECQAIWQIHEFVIMPNHMHLLFELTSGKLRDTMVEFKKWTGSQACKLLHREGQGFWQEEWFDHWSRSEGEDEKIAEYIRQNPVKAKLVKHYQEWPHGSWHSTHDSP